MGEDDRDRPWFSTFLVKTIIIVFFVLNKYPHVCEICVPNRTHPNGRPKVDGGEVWGNCTIDGIFVINRNFLTKYTENQKTSTNKKTFEFNFTYAVQFSSESVKK